MNVNEMDEKQLREAAKKLQVKVPPNIKRENLEEMVQVAQFKKELELKEKAKAERAKDVQKMLNLDPATKAKPSPETIAIANSKKVYAVFHNLEEEGVDVEFNKGCTHNFHWYDQYIHIVPQCLVEENRDRQNPIGKRPIHGMRKDPRIQMANEVSTIIGHKPRYRLEVLGDAPQEAQFGVIIDKKLYDKFGWPFPDAA
jgi:hypothetical protein